MKITIAQLRKIIKEEVSRVVEARGGAPKGFKKLPKEYIDELSEHGGLEEAEEIAAALGKRLEDCHTTTSEDPGFGDIMAGFVADGEAMPGGTEMITMGTYDGQPAVLDQNAQMDSIWI